jgi:hypothetical protein
MATADRTYPLRQPKNYRPPVPRWRLVLANADSRIYTAYIGVQLQQILPKASNPGEHAAVSAVQNLLSSGEDDCPLALETFRVLDGHDTEGSIVWVCYWDSEETYDIFMQRLNLSKIYNSLGPEDKSTLGIWCETFATSKSRLETNYSGLDYLPGLARLPGTSTEQHTLSAYWGAARDRIPDSAHDRFELDNVTQTGVALDTPGIGKHFTGNNYNNMAHIRSGQFWENCTPEEAEAYESTLEPALRAGLAYLWQNSTEAGTMGLRYLRNIDSPLCHSSRDLKETCVAGFFRNLQDLEQWAERHKSHLAIYLGAIKHAKLWGETRKLRTWHEVSILKRGEVKFEYINCKPHTGVIGFMALEDQAPR